MSLSIYHSCCNNSSPSSHDVNLPCMINVMGPLGALRSAHEGCGRASPMQACAAAHRQLQGRRRAHSAARRALARDLTILVFLAPSDAGTPSCAGMCRSAEAAAVSLPGMLRRAPAVDRSRWTWRTPLERTLPFWHGWCLPLTRHFCSWDHHCWCPPTSSLTH